MNKDIEYIKSLNPCSDGLSWANEQKSIESIYDNCDRGDWLIWLLRKSCKITKPQAVIVAIKCAERVLHVYEKKHPDDNRPRKAIEAALKYYESPTEENRKAADAYAADAATDATDAAYAAAYATTSAAAYAAAYAADAAAYAAADAVAKKSERKAQADIIRKEVSNPWRKQNEQP